MMSTLSLEEPLDLLQFKDTTIYYSSKGDFSATCIKCHNLVSNSWMGTIKTKEEFEDFLAFASNFHGYGICDSVF